MALFQDQRPIPERLFRCCLFCNAEMPPSALFGFVPPGSCIAYDPARGRIWAVCGRCRRWNLAPLDERADAIDTLERTVRDRAIDLASTANIALFAWEDLTIIRIGRASFPERAAWRYGRDIMQRAASYHRRRTRAFAAAAAAVARVGESMGIVQLDRHWGPSAAADVIRWSRFGAVAWDGRVACRYCNSVLHTLHFDATWWLYPRLAGGRLVVGVPCTRCDPWSPRNVFDVEGPDAHALLRRVLAYQHVAGAPQDDVLDATRLIRDAGSTDRFIADVATGRTSLWRLGPRHTLALEIAVNGVAERLHVHGLLHQLEAEWRAEEEVAAIIDDELG